MEQSKVHSIWLIPEGKVYDVLKKLIQELSKKFSSPMFEPHVTLVGAIKGEQDSVIKQTERLSQKIKSFTICLEGLDFRDESHLCLFFNTKKSQEYENVINKAINCFKGNYNPKYMKHLSILYGIFPSTIKKKIINSIKMKDHAFIVRKLVLYSTEGEVKNWYRVKEFPLH